MAYVTAQRRNIERGDVLFSIKKATFFSPEHAHHVMVVTETGTVTQELLSSWKNKLWYNGNFKIGDIYAKIVQGNNGSTSMFERGEEDPTDEDYFPPPLLFLTKDQHMSR